MKSSLKARLKNGCIAAPVLVLGVFLLPSWGFLLAIMAVCILGMLEFYLMLDAANIPNFRYLGVAGALALNLAVFFNCIYQLGCNSELLVLFLVIFAILLRQCGQLNFRRTFETVGGTLLGIMYVGFMLSFITRIMIMDGQFKGQWLLFYVLAVIKFSDSGAYFAGSNLGRHKMAPTLSPKKTWEGFIGGILTGLLVSLICFWALDGDFGVVVMRWHDAVLLGLILPGVGALGDLCESLLKRAAGVKDSSSVLKGLGGFLDLADSVLPAVAVLYFWSVFFLN